MGVKTKTKKPVTSKESWLGRFDDIADYIQWAKEAFEEGNMEEAESSLSMARDDADNLLDDLEVP